MKQVTIESVRERIAELEMVRSHGELSLRGEFELACLRALVGRMAVEADIHNIINQMSRKEWAKHCAETFMGSMHEMEVTPLVGRVKPAQVAVPAALTEGYHPAYLAGWNACRAAILNQAQESVTDNTAQQFESLAMPPRDYELQSIMNAMRGSQAAPVAVVKHYTGNVYPTLKFAQNEWCVCGDRDDVQELADAINALAASAAKLS